MVSFRCHGLLLAFALSVLTASNAHAVLDVENKGPTLAAGAFAMRVTNIGSIGNPFADIGRSFDPSFEYPRGSGIEGLKHADLWIGARTSSGAYRVSGGPLLEWRPTLSPDDHVREALGGQLASQPDVDDDGDGRIDEEALNGRDDDGDGEIDEDLGVSASQKLYADYVDDRPEAVAYGYAGGEAHVPLHLGVKQEAMAWSAPGYDRIAGVHFTVTNHGTETLEDVRIGLLADLDVSAAGESGGHVNDLLQNVRYSVPYNDGLSSIPSVDIREFGSPYAVLYSKDCLGTLAGEWPVIVDGAPGNPLPVFSVVPLSHTVDPLAVMRSDRLANNEADDFITGPSTTEFHYSVFAMDLPAGQGGPPLFDADRYLAMAGDFPGPPSLAVPHDYAVLVSCGPFVRMPPGHSYQFDVAFLCAPSLDSMATTMTLAALTHRGAWVNRLADTTALLMGNHTAGKSGFSGHETCYEPPADLTLHLDPHCFQKFVVAYEVPDYSIVLPHGVCTWVDADCDACTGFNGNETLSHWADPVRVPPSPAYHAIPQDRAVTIEWDNSPEVLLRAPAIASGLASVRFTGYNVYRLSDWKRQGLLPGPEKFQVIESFGLDTLNGQAPLATVTDTTMDYDLLRFGAKQYRIGRYRFTDTRVNNGFDYLYVVTTVGERTIRVSPTLSLVERYESPILTSLDSLVTPAAAATERADQVHVVPNPYRAHAQWERPPVAGDTFGRHLDFVGLPRTRCTIKVWTVAGDLVARVDHDGSGGDGEAVEPDLAQWPGRAVGHLPVLRGLGIRPPGRALRGDPVRRRPRSHLLAAGVTAALLAILAIGGCGRAVQSAKPHENVPPGVVAVYPPARSSLVPYDTEIYAQFDRSLDPATVDTTRVFLKQDTRRIPVRVEFMGFVNRIRLVPSQTLDLLTTYTVVIAPGVRTAEGDSLGTILMWQFTTNSLRRVRNTLPSGIVPESPFAMLTWSGNGGARSDVWCEVYASTDSEAVVNRSIPPLQAGAWVFCLPRQRWVAGARNYWAVSLTNLTTGERMAGPVTGFDVYPAGTPVASTAFDMQDYGGLWALAPRSQLCTAQTIGSGPNYNSGVRFDIRGTLLGRRIADARLEMTVSAGSVGVVASAAPSVWYAQATWSNCAFSVPAPPFAESNGQVATGALEGVNTLVFRGDGLVAFVEAVARFNSLPGLLLRSNANMLYDMNVAGSPRLACT